MAKNFTTGLIITGDSKGGVRAVRATRKEIDGLSQGFDQGSKRAQDFTKRSQGVSRELQVMRRMAAPVGAAIAGMFAVNGLRNQIDFADQLQKTNLRIGASTEALSQYNHVAGLAGVQFNELTTAWQRQSRRVAQAAKDTGEAQEALATLNLDAAELAKLAPEQQFERIAGAMGGVANEAQRVALAQKIWDSEGVKLLQIVNQGTDAIRAQREEADRLGLTISEDTANAMAAFNDEVTTLKAVSEGLSRQILADLVPSMTSGMQATSAWIDEMGGAEEILDTIKMTTGGLATLLAGRYVGALASSTAELVAKTAASIADAKAEATAAQQVARRTAAEKTAAMALLASARTEEQATRGTAAHRVALDQLSAARVRATEAAGAHTAATNTAAAAMGRASVTARGLAAANRAGAAAMTALGGPLGLLVGGGGLLFMFREELGLVDTASQNATGALKANTQAIRDGGEAALNSSYEALTLSLEEVSLQAQEAMAQLVELEARERFYAKSNKGVAESVRAAISEQHAALAGLWERQVELQQAIEENRKRREDLTRADREGVAVLKTLDEWLFETSETTQQHSQSTESAAESTDTFSAGLKSLREQLDPAYAASQRLSESTEILDQGLASGALTLGQYLDLWDKAAGKFIEARNGSDDATDSINDNTDEMATLWERRLERMDDASVDMWRSFLNGSEDAFSSFKRLAINSLAEVIHAYSTQRIT
ncbi:hypothetical protein NPJ88_011525, partial [Halomonas elongata]|uniref:hypothetical protein n=1 Tax=Halomonas elongata TaxID=2746 RepID=UPI00255AE788